MIDNLFYGLRDRLVDRKGQWSKNEISNEVLGIKDEIKRELEKEGRIVVTHKLHKVKELRKYDLIYMPTYGSFHYLVVYRILKKIGKLYAFSITSKERYAIDKIQLDRLFEGNYIGKTLIEYDYEECKNNFVKVYENKREIDLIFKRLKEYHRTALRL